MIIVLSKFEIANEMSPDVKNAFCSRPHVVDSTPGFIKLQVMSPKENGNEIWLMTYWETEEYFKQWHSSHGYHETHKGIPKGLKLVPQSVELKYFDFICD